MSEKDKGNQYMPWQDGLPTAPDVALLQQTWQHLKSGDRIEYEVVAKLLGVPIGSNRWKSITDAWRARELDRSIVINCDPGAAFFVASPEQITGNTYAVLRHVGRSAKKQRQKLSTFRPDTDLLRSSQEHHSRLMMAVERESKRSRMNILPPASAQPAPQIAAPDDATGGRR